MPRSSRALRPALASLPLFTALLAGCTIVDPGPPLQVDAPWSRRMASGYGSEVTGLAVDASGHIALGGIFDEKIDLGLGERTSPFGRNLFVGYFDGGGRPSWNGFSGGPGMQEASSVALAPNGDIVLAGTFTTEVDFGLGPLETTRESVFVARFDRSGHALWNRQFDSKGGALRLTAMAVDGEGAILLGGDFWVDMTIGETHSSFEASSFVARLAPDGTPIFSLPIHGVNNIADVAADATGALVAAGTGFDSIEIGDLSWSSPGEQGVFFVTRVGADGSAQLLTTLTSGGEYLYGSPNAIAIDEAGDVVLAGSFGGAIDFGGESHHSSDAYDIFVAKLASDGQPRWLNSYSAGPYHYGAANDVVVDADGQIVFTGYYDGQIDFGGGPLASQEGRHAFLTELDADGHHVKSRDFSAPDFPDTGSVGTALAIDPLGGVILAGSFNGKLAFDDQLLGVDGDGDGGGNLFLARIQR